MGWIKAFLWIVTLHTEHVLFRTQEQNSQFLQFYQKALDL